MTNKSDSAKAVGEPFDEALKLVYEAYAKPRDQFHEDHGYIVFLRGKITKAFSLLQSIKSAAPTPSAQAVGEPVACISHAYRAEPPYGMRCRECGAFKADVDAARECDS
jgi:hypothetical protein